MDRLVAHFVFTFCFVKIPRVLKLLKRFKSLNSRSWRGQKERIAASSTRNNESVVNEQKQGVGEEELSEEQAYSMHLHDVGSKVDYLIKIKDTIN